MASPKMKPKSASISGSTPYELVSAADLLVIEYAEILAR
jgi:hypothetical protein